MQAGYFAAGETGEHGNLTSVETKVAHMAGSKASLALEGRMVPSHEWASNRGRGLWRCRLAPPDLSSPLEEWSRSLATTV